MKVVLRTRYASARGQHEPGSQVDLPDNEAKELVAAGYAVAVGQIEVASTRTGRPRGRNAVSGDD